MKVAAPMIHIEVIIIGLGHNHKHHRHWIKGCAVVGVRHSIIEGFSSSPCVITGIIIMIKNFYHHLPLCQFSSEWDYFLFFVMLLVIIVLFDMERCPISILAAHNSSIGDLVTQSVSDLLILTKKEEVLMVKNV